MSGRAGVPELRTLLEDGAIHVLDGAMGTMLYQRGVFVNVCYDGLVLDEPDMVTAIHREYVDAGAEILETNTFGANPVKLSAFSVAERTEEINRAAARLAVAAAGGRARVMGAVGPLGIRIEPWGPTGVDEARAHFRRQIEGLVEGGVDGILLETFADLNELEAALATAREVGGGRPVFAQVTVGEEGRTSYGTDGADALRRLADLGADAVGFNCSVGPATLLDLLDRVTGSVHVPLVAQPNAGQPRTVRDRKMYLASPEYMARYAQRFAEAGVRFIGGCCGTTPDHIAQVARLVAGLQPRHSHASVRARAQEGGPGTEPPALAGRSRLGAALAEGRWVTTVELVPPRGWQADAMLEAARRAGEAGVTAVSVLDAPRGRSRMGALPAASLLLKEAGVEPVMHYTCRDRNMMGMLSDLLGAAAAGIRNVLLVSGDPPVQGPYPDATGVFDIDAIGLTNVAAGLNRGLDPGGGSIGSPTSFVVGVAVNPGAVDRERELSRFRWKAEAGADYAVTQPVFDLEDLKALLAETTGAGVPLLVGLWPFTSLRNAEFLAHEVPGVAVPETVLARMARAQEKGSAAARAEGIAVCREVLERVRDLDGVAGVHVATPGGDVEAALGVLAEP